MVRQESIYGGPEEGKDAKRRYFKKLHFSNVFVYFENLKQFLFFETSYSQAMVIKHNYSPKSVCATNLLRD